MKHNFEAILENNNISKSISENTENMDSVVQVGNQQQSLDISAGAGFFIILSIFFMFLLMPMTALLSVGLQINLLPIIMVVMISILVAAAFFMLLRVFDISL